MLNRFLHTEQKDEAKELEIVQGVELSDEEMEQVAGGYIIAGPAGQLDWLRRQMYYRTHPGQVQPLVATN